MSTPSGEYNGTADEELEIYWLDGAFIFSSTAFFVYSYLLLLGQEIEHVWKQPRRPSSWLYALIRYPTLVTILLYTGLNSYTPNCNALAQLGDWSQNIALIVTYVVQILRTYAVCGNKRPLAGLLIAVCLPAIAIDSLQAVKTTCATDYTLSPVIVTVQIVFDIAFESIIVSATVWGTWSQVAASKQLGLSRGTLAHALLRNGLMYFIIFLAFQMSYLVSYNLKATPTVTKIILFSDQFADIIRYSLICQFILELRERSVAPGSISGVSLPTTSSRSIRGTMEFFHASIELDLGEPPFRPIHSMDLHETDESTPSGVSRMEQKEPEEGIELWECNLAQINNGEGGIDA